MLHSHLSEDTSLGLGNRPQRVPRLFMIFHLWSAALSMSSYMALLLGLGTLSLEVVMMTCPPRPLVLAPSRDMCVVPQQSLVVILEHWATSCLDVGVSEDAGFGVSTSPTSSSCNPSVAY